MTSCYSHLICAKRDLDSNIHEHSPNASSAEDEEPASVTYKINIGGKLKVKVLPATAPYEEWRAMVIDASGWSETRKFKHELTWKPYAAPKTHDPAAIDDKGDYIMMVNEIRSSCKAGKSAVIAIFIANLVCIVYGF